VAAALLKEGPFLAPPLLSDSTIQGDLAHSCVREPAGKVVQRVVKGAEHHRLFPALQDFRNQRQHGGRFGNVGSAGAVRRREGGGPVAFPAMLDGRSADPCAVAEFNRLAGLRGPVPAGGGGGGDAGRLKSCMSAIPSHRQP